MAAETDVSIRPGWFYRDSENDKVKSLDHLLKIYYESVGRNSLLLLNVPPDKRGLIHSIDSVRLLEFRSALDGIFACDLTEGATVYADNVRRGAKAKYGAENMLDEAYDSYWAADDDCLTPSFTVTFPEPRTFNRVMLQEYIPLGQRVAAFSIEALGEDGQWREIADETTIGYKRIVLVPTVTASAVRVNIDRSYACPVINGFAVYMDNIYEAASEDIGNAGGRIKRPDEVLTADLGQVRPVKGFVYTPVLKGRGGCIVTYDLAVSRDGNSWDIMLTDKMFDNIVNNPVRQEVMLDHPVNARFVRLIPRRTSEDSYGVSVFEVIE